MWAVLTCKILHKRIVWSALIWLSWNISQNWPATAAHPKTETFAQQMSSVSTIKKIRPVACAPTVSIQSHAPSARSCTLVYNSTLIPAAQLKICQSLQLSRSKTVGSYLFFQSQRVLLYDVSSRFVSFWYRSFSPLIYCPTANPPDMPIHNYISCFFYTLLSNWPLGSVRLD